MDESFSVKLCSDKISFEVKPSRTRQLDLPELSIRIAEQLEMKIRVNLPALLLLESDDGRVVNIFPTGRLLFRNFPNREAVQKALELLTPLLIGSQ